MGDYRIGASKEFVDQTYGDQTDTIIFTGAGTSSLEVSVYRKLVTCTITCTIASGTGYTVSILSGGNILPPDLRPKMAAIYGPAYIGNNNAKVFQFMVTDGGQVQLIGNSKPAGNYVGTLMYLAP